MGPRIRMVALENKKISLPVPGIETQLLVCAVRRKVSILTTPLRLSNLQQLRIINVFPCLNRLDLILGSRFLPCSSSSVHSLPRTSIFLLSHFLLCSWGYSIPFILSRPRCNYWGLSVMRLGAATLTQDKVCPTVADLTAKLFNMKCTILSFIFYIFHANVLYTRSFLPSNCTICFITSRCFGCTSQPSSGS